MIKKIIIGIFVSGLVVSSAYGVPTASIKPNAAVTPGAINPNVTQSNIRDTVCKANWTSTIRPPVSYTNKLKSTQLETTYKSFVSIYGALPSGYEEDHLISLQLGGSPTDPKNLWPEPYAGDNARKKDVIETVLKRLICTGQITLQEAQRAIATDWVATYKKIVTAPDLKGVESNG